MSPAADQPASTPWANDDQSYFDALETRLAASLRKRVVWCCIIGIFLMLIGVLGTVFWIWMIVDCALHESSTGNDKIVWILVILFTHLIGALLYYFVRRPRRPVGGVS